MNEHPVALVVLQDFGLRLDELAARLHVWLVETPANEEAARRVWAHFGSARGLDRGVTVFDPASTGPLDEIACDVLLTIDEHHPGWTRLEVYGTPATNRLQEELGELGFTVISPTPDGFSAVRSPGATES